MTGTSAGGGQVTRLRSLGQSLIAEIYRAWTTGPGWPGLPEYMYKGDSYSEAEKTS